MRKILAVLLCLALAGCATTAPKFGSISLGMSKQEVVSVLGQPFSVSVQGRNEYLIYVTHFGVYLTPYNETGRYFVRLIDGKVESYGKVGDFDSTKDSTQVVKVIGDVKTDQTITTQSANEDGLENKLNTLKKLLSDGLITQDEFNTRKKALLDAYTNK